MRKPPPASHRTPRFLSRPPLPPALAKAAQQQPHGEARGRNYATTLYTAPKGNLVFNAATCWWNMVLSAPPGFMSPPRRYFKEPDARIQRITKNVLNKMIAAAPVER